MSNSELVVYKKLSPNKTHPRNHAIDTITIHVVDGDLTVEQIGTVFARKERSASSNYGVDSKGRIGLYVDEQDRSWCSSNKANDMRAVTIEVANDGGKNTGYHVSDAALIATIELVADICRRNDISELVWSNTKADRINHRNGCNMTVHRDFANKACPGDYLMGKMPYIADTVNMLLHPSTEKNPYREPEITVTSKANALLKGCKNFICEGEGVSWMQWEIARLGFYNMNIDGKCGKGTVNAIKDLQTIAGLKVDGLGGPATRKAIKSR